MTVRGGWDGVRKPDDGEQRSAATVPGDRGSARRTILLSCGRTCQSSQDSGSPEPARAAQKASFMRGGEGIVPEGKRIHARTHRQEGDEVACCVGWSVRTRCWEPRRRRASAR